MRVCVRVRVCVCVRDFVRVSLPCFNHHSQTHMKSKHSTSHPHPLHTTHTRTLVDAYETHLFIPWKLFAPEFRPTPRGRRGDATSAHDPWPLWRANFYRYDYPSGPNKAFDNYELTGWSPTHDPSFHVPERFGVLVFDDV